MEGTYLDFLKAVQEGDFKFIQDALSDRDRIKVSIINTLDQDHCSLLHWAAINNRIEIANYLIENGLSHALSGGILDETPLQWAIRKRYYKMMSLIYTKTHCNLHHKSSQGLDALHLCCKLGDIYGSFLLLHWGANPDAIDNNGDTPILSLLKNRTESSKVTPKTKNEIIKLLLRFGADACRSNINDGNTPLHAVVTSQGIDESIAFTIYQGAGPLAKDIKNNDEKTPYKLATSSDHRNQANFLFHALVYYALPYYFPSLACCCLVFIAFYCITSYGIILGSVYGSILAGITALSLFQLPITDHFGRVIYGAFLGFMISWIYTYYVYIAPLVSSHFVNLITYILVVGSLYSMYRFINTKPIFTVKMENRAKLAAQIVESSPLEGTDEEASLLADGTTTIDGCNSVEIIPTAITTATKFTKDKITGHLYRETAVVDRETTTDVVPQSRKRLGRILGPRLCALCLCDRRGTVTQYSSSTSLTGFPCVSMLLPPLNNNNNNKSAIDKTKSNPPLEVISLASHCVQCDLCVIDQDHHCLLLNNCVGKGNRRMFWVFLLSFALFLCLFFFTSKYVHHYHTCADQTFKSWILVNFISREWCALHSSPALYILSCGSFMLGCYFVALLQVQAVIKSRYEWKAPSYRTRVRNVLTFLYTGQYNVTYAKKPKKNKDSDNKNDINANEETALINQDLVEYNRAMLLLKNIDNQLYMKNNPEEHVGNFKKETITISNRNATTTYDAPDINSNLDQNTLMSISNNSKGCNAKHCHSCDTAVFESDYDEEYVLSSKNNYLDYYFNDSDEDKNTTTKLSHSNHDTNNKKQLNNSTHNHHNCSNSKHNHHSHNPKTNAKVLGILADERV